MPAILHKPYCTVRQVQAHTRNSDAGLNDKYVECINRASRFIEEHCFRDFWFHNHLTTESAPNNVYRIPRHHIAGESVYFPWPVLSAVNVWVRLRNESRDASTLLDPNEWTVDNAGFSGRIILDKPLEFDYKGHVEVEGTFGYTLQPGSDPELFVPLDIPSGVNHACILVAAAWSTEYRVQQIGLDGGRTELLDDKIPKEALRLLSRFRFIQNEV